MKKKHCSISLVLLSINMVILLSFLLFFGCSKDDNNSEIPSTNETGTVTDIDGNSYQTVKIGDQWWMAENLRVTHYRNGDLIHHVTNLFEWVNMSTGAYCAYEDLENVAVTYGYLYNWYAVNDSRNIAPEGWHVPTDYEWETLINYLGGDEVAGGKMKATIHWNKPNKGANNESGFSALPCGYRSSGWGRFQDLGDYAYFWTKTEWTSGFALRVRLECNNSSVSFSDNYTKAGFSVRLIRD